MRTAVISILLVASTAHAQPGAMAPRPAPDEVSETTALALSLGTTAASYAALTFAVTVHSSLSEPLGTIGALGIFGAPTAGHWYAGRLATRGLGLRAAGFIVALVGGLIDSEGCSLVYSGHGDPEPEDCGDNFRTTKGTVVMAVGASMFVFGTVDDIVTAPAAARGRNAKLRAEVTLAPIVRHDGGGLALAGTF